ncbi:MAG TPA: hypothetical protein VHE14_04575, partial [Solirubrobacteraceae bacterium]|nr:hypothetical protein [Solirubrobacteraceae bacterium]
KGGRWTMTPWRQRPTDLRVELPGGVRIGEYRAFRVRRGGRVDFGDSHRAQIGRRGLVWLSWRMRERDGDQRTLLRVRRQNDPGSGFVADVHRAVLADQLTALSVLVGLVIVLFDVLAPTPELGGGGGG